MKIFNKTGVLRLLAVVMAAVTLGMANAADRLYIENFAINSTQPKKVAIMLDNTSDVAAMQFNIDLPQGLKINDISRNNDRFNAGQNMTWSKGRNLVLVTSGQGKSFIGNSGPICWIEVEASQQALESGENLQIKLSNIILSNAVGGNIPTDKTSSSIVSVQDGIASLSTEKAFVMNPGDVKKVSVDLSTNFEIYGMQMEIVLPAGFSIQGNEVFAGSMLANGDNVKLVPRADGVSYGLVITNFNGVAAVNGTSGQAFWFNLVAPQDFSADVANVNFVNFLCSNRQNKTLVGEGTGITISNGVTAYNKALQTVSTLETSLSDALAEIADKAPDVKDLYDGSSIASDIENLKSAVEAAYADHTLTPDYDSVMSPVEGIQTAIANLINDAIMAEQDWKDAQARQAKLNEANARITDLETHLTQALAKIAEVAPDVKDQFPGTEIADRIQAMKDDVQKAFDNKTIIEDYDTLMAPAATIDQDIDRMITDAENAQAAFEADQAQKALDAAKANADKLISDLRSQLDKAGKTIDALKDVAADYKKQVLALDNDIDNLAKAIDAAYADRTLTADYNKVAEAPAAELSQKIEKMVEDAQAAQSKYEADSNANNAAKATADAAVAEMTNALNAALATINSECKDVRADFTGNEISNRIAAIKNAVDAAYANRTLAADVDNILSGKPAILADIQTLLDNALAAQKEFDDNKALAAAIDKANAATAALDNQLNNALEQIAKNCPDVAAQFNGSSIKVELSALKLAVTTAINDKTLALNYETIMAPVQKISDDIKALVADAEKAEAAFKETQALNDAKAKADKVVADLRSSLAAARATIAAECPDVKDAFSGNNVEGMIDAIVTDINNAYSDKTLSKDYMSIVTLPAKDVETAIARLVSDAKAAQAAHSSLEGAYANAKAKIAELQNSLNATLAKIADECPDVKDDFDGAKVKALINNLSNTVEETYKNGSLSKDYNTIMSAAGNIETEISALYADAKAAEKLFQENKQLADAFKNANATADNLDKALANALATIAAECPDVKDNFKGTEISNSIETMRTNILNAFNSKTLVQVYESVVTAPAAKINDAIAKLIDDAKAAQKTFKDNEALANAYASANTEVAKLRSDLAQALKTISTEAPNVKNEFTGEEISASIENLRAQIDAAFTNKTLTEKYDEVMAPAAGISDAIAKLVADAKAAQKAYEEKVALDKAYADANAAIAGLNDELAKALEQIAAEAADVADDFKGTEITESIDNLKKAVEAANADGTLTAKYDEVMAPAAGISDAIAKLVADAKAAQKAYEEKVALDKAYADANAAIAGLNDELAKALEQIAAEAADVADDFKGTEITESIDNLKKAVEAANADGTLTAKYDEVMAPAAGISDAIAKLVADAKAAQKAYEENQARIAANEAAFKEDMDIINGMREKLAEAEESITLEYPDFDMTEMVDAINETINAQEEQAKKALEDVADEGTYENSVDTTEFEEQLAKLLEEAKNSGVMFILGEEVTDDVRIFSLDGRQMPAVQPGKVNILVYPNGKIQKVLVK
ncbi:MAG: hypothetical protein NC328_06985 [Muribaculum sp.]|nr:hypothetical protein [Muribaculum sp.]